MPDRIDAIWTSADGAALRERQRSLEAAFTAELKVLEALDPRCKTKLRARHIRGKADLQRHVDTCHFAPVRHGWTREPEDWPHSTIHHMAPSDMILT
ncbi:hypothetical protein DC366_02480 [Pelagivirga sediminicola]|uniref:Uncharacterized protein n=1 Tax=Pelagivirga sediminicola TaxID=2170575 RepID=A0A2T7GBM5_9RHOB|nr:hypothetical protein DC366_02480 [Pelagivirga sediminicola]